MHLLLLQNSVKEGLALGADPVDIFHKDAVAGTVIITLVSDVRGTNR